MPNLRDFFESLSEAEEAEDQDTEKKPADKKTGFHTSIENDTVKNNFFRKVLFTGPNAQLVVMSLKPGEDIGMETHADLDQFIRVDKGTGTASIGGKEYDLKDGDAVVIPAGSEHDITAGDDGLKIYTVYTSNNHPDMQIDKTKADAQKREKEGE